MHIILGYRVSRHVNSNHRIYQALARISRHCLHALFRRYMASRGGLDS
jgi:hypothetical protein